MEGWGGKDGGEGSACTTKDVQRFGVAFETNTGESRYCTGYENSVTFSHVFVDNSG